ncbi:MAG TPA: heat-inducible transcriptional repressor HrcA [Pantanalinema sp.]
MFGNDFRLTPRKQHILRAVIRDYIQTAEPVGSRTLSRKYDLGLSPATIRNELSDLEEEGLLRQPHASSGRVPSDHGYRVFVDNLMEPGALSLEQREQLARTPLRAQELPELMLQTAKLTAVLAGCTAIVRAPRQADSRIKFIQLMPVAEQDVLLIMLTDRGQVSNQLIRLPEPLSTEELMVVANFLNEQLRDRALDQLTQDALSEVSGKLSAYHAVLSALWDRIPRSKPSERLYLSHQSYLAQQPEFGEMGKVGHLLTLLEQDRVMLELMDALASGARDKASVAIGSENPLTDFRECSVVTAPYRLGEQVLGEVAVIGPTRMHYATAIAAVEAMAERLSSALTDLYGLEPPSGPRP